MERINVSIKWSPSALWSCFKPLIKSGKKIIVKFFKRQGGRVVEEVKKITSKNRIKEMRRRHKKKLITVEGFYCV